MASSLVTRDQMQDAIEELARSWSGHDVAVIDAADRQLAATLVRMEVLTSYQADQLLAGRTKLNLGPYLITDWIGQGGMGQVFKAVHRMLGRQCAVKVLPLNKSTPEAIANFRREIQAQARLDHPNLVRAYDAGEDGSVHYLVVEYVPGTDLRRLVRTHGKLTVQQAANIVKQAAEGLAHAHQCNIIHRDIKPGNILVPPDGRSKLSDLGLAAYLNDPSDTRAGKIVGTADYLSPEQIRSPADVTKASDIYSLGCTLYYAVTGKVPFPGGTPKSKAKRHLEETPWHPRRFNEECPDEFVDLIGDMMEKDAAIRIQTAEEVAERLAPWAVEYTPIVGRTDIRSRWMPAPLPSDGSQDTDPALAGSESSQSISAHGERSDATYAISDSETMPSPEYGATQIKPPPPPLSVNEQFSAAGHLPKDEPAFSLTTLAIVALSALGTGLLIGFAVGFLSTQ